MDTRLLCCFALCLWGADSLDVKVTQTPAHLVRGAGQKARMTCTPAKGHDYVYWYRQVRGEGLTFLVYFRKDEIFEQIDLVKQRFSADCLQNSACTLEVKSSLPEDSALYFCASSESQHGTLSHSWCTN